MKYINKKLLKIMLGTGITLSTLGGTIWFMNQQPQQEKTEEIKEEEHRRKKSENHLIEKKVRTINTSDKILVGTDREEYKTSPKRLTNQETLKYVRVGNKVICTITNEYGKFQGMATQHPEDVFDYEKGMTLARIRAMRSMYSKLESALVSQM